MSRYGVKPELLDSVAESFLALENSTDHSSGSEKEEMKEEVYEFLKDYKEKFEKFNELMLFTIVPWLSLDRLLNV